MSLFPPISATLGTEVLENGYLQNHTAIVDRSINRSINTDR
jgi:hypothetical protein